ncbi:hypothetical protein QA601_18695 [Chitinispirillales bacterium ANBcel5]|uniref:hypothetical protein n=1 Tax=Cellulosispirillum alkaliphilum TaxID=3039283 RepID=UPI002A57CAF2|nr:hypothetical protein [Chitinispirillales bacterium ANBcel5]
MKKRWHYWVIGYLSLWFFLLFGWFAGNSKWGYTPPRTLPELLKDFMDKPLYWLIVVAIGGIVGGEIIRMYIPQKK